MTIYPAARARIPPRAGRTVTTAANCDKEERLAGTECPAQLIDWAAGGLELRIEVAARRHGQAYPARPAAPRVARCRRPAARRCRCSTSSWPARAASWSGGRYCESEAGDRFRYAATRRSPKRRRAWRELRVDLDDPVTGLRAEVFYRVLRRGRSRRRAPLLGAAWRTGGAAGHGRVGDLVPVRRPCARRTRGPTDLADLDVLWAENDWMAEGRWQPRALRDALPDIGRQALGPDPAAASACPARTWSSGRTCPRARS